jgi:hypothetical protein
MMDKINSYTIINNNGGSLKINLNNIPSQSSSPLVVSLAGASNVQVGLAIERNDSGMAKILDKKNTDLNAMPVDTHLEMSYRMDLKTAKNFLKMLLRAGRQELKLEYNKVKNTINFIKVMDKFSDFEKINKNILSGSNLYRTDEIYQLIEPKLIAEQTKQEIDNAMQLIRKMPRKAVRLEMFELLSGRIFHQFFQPPGFVGSYHDEELIVKFKGLADKFIGIHPTLHPLCENIADYSKFVFMLKSELKHEQNPSDTALRYGIDQRHSFKPIFKIIAFDVACQLAREGENCNEIAEHFGITTLNERRDLERGSVKYYKKMLNSKTTIIQGIGAKLKVAVGINVPVSFSEFNIFKNMYDMEKVIEKLGVITPSAISKLKKYNHYYPLFKIHSQKSTSLVPNATSTKEC